MKSLLNPALTLLLLAPATLAQTKYDYDAKAALALASAAEGEKLEPACKIERRYGQTVGSGSGTVVGVREVLTVRHLVSDGDEPGTYSVFLGDKKYNARLVGVGLADDLALLETDEDLPAAVPEWSKQVPKPTMKVSSAGVASGHREGRIVSPGDSDPKLLYTSLRAVPGDSGSGVFDSEGKLLGVAWGWKDGVQRATSTEVCKRFVESKSSRAFTNYQDAAQYAQKVNKPILLYFERPGCTHCDEFKAYTIGEQFPGAVLCVQFVDQDPKLAEVCKVTSLPTIMIGKPSDPSPFKVSGSLPSADVLRAEILRRGK